MGMFSDVAMRYARVRILLVLVFAMLVGVAVGLSPLLGDGGALLGVFGLVVVGMFMFLAVHAIPR